MENANGAKRESWEKRITEQELSGLSRMDWCARQGVKYTTFRYWREQIGKQPAKKMAVQATTTWLELDPSSIVSIPASTEGLVVHIGEATVELRRGFDAELLREIVHALASA